MLLMVFLVVQLCYILFLVPPLSLTHCRQISVLFDDSLDVGVIIRLLNLLCALCINAWTSLLFTLWFLDYTVVMTCCHNAFCRHAFCSVLPSVCSFVSKASFQFPFFFFTSSSITFLGLKHWGGMSQITFCRTAFCFVCFVALLPSSIRILYCSWWYQVSLRQVSVMVSKFDSRLI